MLLKITVLIFLKKASGLIHSLANRDLTFMSVAHSQLLLKEESEF